ncbi:MAG TPA: hypothetical protein VIY48_06055, partial [Candidatus Paceibacterota bacterium]
HLEKMWRHGARYGTGVPSSAWYKPFHEPSREQIAMSDNDKMKAIDDHDLRTLLDFWRSELKSIEVHRQLSGWRGEPVGDDEAIAKDRVARYRAEIERRKADG